MSEEAEAKMVSQEEHDGLKVKLDEFRTNNVKLMKDIASLQSQFDGVDIYDYREMVKSRDEQKDKKLIDSGKIDEPLEERTKRMREDHNKLTGKMEEENSVRTRQLEGITIDNAIRDQAVKHGIASTAIQDVILRAKVLFRLNDGPISHSRRRRLTEPNGLILARTVFSPITTTTSSSFSVSF